MSKIRRIFINNMNTWFNNSLIEELRNEKEQDKNVIKNIFLGTMDINSKIPLPKLFEPEIVDFNQIEKILKCNVFIINLNCCNFYEIENLLDVDSNNILHAIPITPPLKGTASLNSFLDDIRRVEDGRLFELLLTQKNINGVKILPATSNHRFRIIFRIPPKVF